MSVVAAEEEVEKPQSQEIVEKEASGLVPVALSIKVVDAESYALANDVRSKIKSARKAWSGIMGPICDAAHKTWKTATGKRGEVDDPMAEAEKHLNGEMASHEQRERDIAAQRQRDAETAQRKLEEDRRLGEAARLEKIAAEEAAKASEKLAEAKALEGAGRDVEASEKREEANGLSRSAESGAAHAEAILEAPITAAPVKVETAAPKIAGVSYRDNWKAEGQDIKATIKAAAEGNPLAIAALTWNTTGIGGSAKALKAEYQVPGIKVWNERVLIDRGGK